MSKSSYRMVRIRTEVISLSNTLDTAENISLPDLYLVPGVTFFHDVGFIIHTTWLVLRVKVLDCVNNDSNTLEVAMKMCTAHAVS